MVYDSIAKMWAQKYDALVFANDHSEFYILESVSRKSE